MKVARSVNILEANAIDAVRNLLADLPDAEVQTVGRVRLPGPGDQLDGLISLTLGGSTRLIALEVKSDGAPRFIRAAIYRLESCIARLRRWKAEYAAQEVIAMIVCPYLPPASREICRDHGVAYLDFEGNAYLAFDTVYVERTVPHQPKTETRSLRSIFTPKASAILRAFLSEPDRAWRVAELAAAAGASLGHVSNVRKALLNREWIEKQDGGVVLTRPSDLLEAWRENYRRPSGNQVTGYTHLHGKQFDERLHGLLNNVPERPRAIYSLNSAAQWLAPFIRDGTRSFYTDASGADRLREVLELAPAGAGANVVACIPTDESLFNDALEPVPEVFCTGPITTYLDLWCGNEREREAADHLAREVLPWIA